MAITYPVDQTKRYDFYDSETQEIVSENVRWPRADGMQVKDLAANLVPLVHVVASQTTDPLTQQLGDWLPAVIDTEAGTATHSRAVVELDLPQVKEQKKAAIDQEFEQAIAAGYDTGLGVVLRLSTVDRAAFSQRQQLVDKAVELGQMAPTDTTLISGVDDKVLEVEAQQLGGILLAYGLHYDTLWSRKANARNAINDATTIQDVLAITF